MKKTNELLLVLLLSLSAFQALEAADQGNGFVYDNAFGDNDEGYYSGDGDDDDDNLDDDDDLLEDIFD